MRPWYVVVARSAMVPVVNPQAFAREKEAAPGAPRAALVAFAIFALLGVVFSAVSTYDFVAHLDRQVHAITCSIVPGLGPRDASGTSGCHAVLMSPYSSVLRSLTWGGIPIALPALGVFAFLFFRGLDLSLRRGVGRGETGFLIVAALLPVATSAIYLWISEVELGTVCTVCAGIYGASLGVLVTAIWAHRGAPRRRDTGSNAGQWLLYFLEGCALVLIPVMLYVVQKPAYPDALARKNELRHPEDRYGVMLKSKGTGSVPAIEVLDPLCPACKAFSQRLAASDLGRDLALQTVLFPLDKDCNWMVNESLHPGSCAVSEAVLCAGEKSGVVLEWAFAHQPELLAAGAHGQGEVYARLKQEFPELAPCLGQPLVRTRLNRSLRWVVANSLPVLTPQLFVRNHKIPDEDTDLGLDFVLARTLENAQRARAGRCGDEAGQAPLPPRARHPAGSGAPATVWTRASATRLTESLGKVSDVATASAANEGYCSGNLKQILRRVLTSCGLIQGGGSRGCQPLQARQVAAMSGGDFNSLFAPLAQRAAIIQFDLDKADLDPAAMELLEKTFADQRGASYFLVVSRASPEGSVEHNRELSHHRADAVLEHIKGKFNDPELEARGGPAVAGRGICAT